MILLSVIIPVYNVEDYIVECLDSVRKQNFVNKVEFICINDGSTDNSGIICDLYAKEDTRFRVIHKSNGGLSDVRNVGLRESNGMYIAWIDPDDYISDNWAESVEPFLNGDNDLVFFDYYSKRYNDLISVVYSDASKFIEVDTFLKDLSADLILKSYLWQKIIKKDLYNGISFDVDIKCMEDYAELHKIILRLSKIYYINKNLYIYRLRANSLVNSIDISKSYRCYLIAKERYNYLLSRGFFISKVGICSQALGVYDACVRKKELTENEKKLKKKCTSEIKRNLYDLLEDEKCSFLLKIKFLLCLLGIYRPVQKIYQFLLGGDYRSV